jgi:hypothetical protein
MGEASNRPNQALESFGRSWVLDLFWGYIISVL